MWSSWAITWRSGRFPCGTSKASSRRSHDRSCRYFLWNPTSPHSQRFLTLSHCVLTGVLNLRQHSLLLDSVFLWDTRRSDKSGPWQLALRIWGHWPWLGTCSGLVRPPLAAPGLNLLITHCPYFLGFIAATCHIVRKQAGVSDKAKSSQKRKKGTFKVEIYILYVWFFLGFAVFCSWQTTRTCYILTTRFWANVYFSFSMKMSDERRFNDMLLLNSPNGWKHSHSLPLPSPAVMWLPD